MDSHSISAAYYEGIGHTGLEEQADAERTAQELDYLRERLQGDDVVLDAGCGYGRIALPLAREGFSVSGVDLSADMVSAASRRADQAGVAMDLRVGDLRDLPFADASFTVALCLWSSFSSLLTREDQLSALAELHRVLRPGGWALIDVPDGDRERWDLRVRGSGPDGHVIKNYFVGGNNAVYLHDSATAEELCAQSVFLEWEVLRDYFGGRRRMLLILRR